MQKRYIVNTCQGKTGGGYVYIYDRALMGECGLPVVSDNLSATYPLRWTYEGSVHGPDAFLAWDRASRWLQRCEVQWGKNPGVDEQHPQDVDWALVESHLREAARVQSYGV